MLYYAETLLVIVLSKNFLDYFERDGRVENTLSRYYCLPDPRIRFRATRRLVRFLKRNRDARFARSTRRKRRWDPVRAKKISGTRPDTTPPRRHNNTHACHRVLSYYTRRTTYSKTLMTTGPGTRLPSSGKTVHADRFFHSFFTSVAARV